MILGHLRNLQQPSLPLVINDSTTLDIRLGFVGHLHDVFGLAIDHGLHDVEVDDSAQVVDVGDEDVFLTGCDELVKEARVARRCQSTLPANLGLCLLTLGHRRYPHDLEGTNSPCPT